MNALLSELELARAGAPLDSAWTLPPAAYTDPAVFALETRELFPREWLCVARAADLARPGDFRCVDLLGQPLVVVRGQDHAVRAMSRVCLHRAMPLVEGSGHANRFVCPYHNWTYELDGRLRSAPMMDGVEGFEPATCRLPALRVETWQGFVFVNFDPDAEQLAPRLDALERLIGNYGFDDLVTAATLEFHSPWNWKILVENFMEAYHHIGIHRHSFERVYPARDAVVEDNDGGPWALLRMPGKVPEGAETLPPLPGLTAAQRHELMAGCIFPTTLFAASGSLGVWYEVLPEAHDRMTLRIHALLRPEVAAALDDDARAAVIEGLRQIHLEDIPANEGPWRGLHAPLATQGRLSRHERAIWQLNQLWLRRLWGAAGPAGWRRLA